MSLPCEMLSVVSAVLSETGAVAIAVYTRTPRSKDGSGLSLTSGPPVHDIAAILGKRQ